MKDINTKVIVLAGDKEVGSFLWLTKRLGMLKKLNREDGGYVFRWKNYGHEED